MIQDDDNIVVKKVVDFAHFEEDLIESYNRQLAVERVRKDIVERGWWKFIYLAKQPGSCCWETKYVTINAKDYVGFESTIALLKDYFIAQMDEMEVTFLHKLQEK